MFGIYAINDNGCEWVGVTDFPEDIDGYYTAYPSHTIEVHEIDEEDASWWESTNE